MSLAAEVIDTPDVDALALGLSSAEAEFFRPSVAPEPARGGGGAGAVDQGCDAHSTVELLEDVTGACASATGTPIAPGLFRCIGHLDGAVGGRGFRFIPRPDARATRNLPADAQRFLDANRETFAAPKALSSEAAAYVVDFARQEDAKIKAAAGPCGPLPETCEQCAAQAARASFLRDECELGTDLAAEIMGPFDGHMAGKDVRAFVKAAPVLYQGGTGTRIADAEILRRNAIAAEEAARAKAAAEAERLRTTPVKCTPRGLGAYVCEVQREPGQRVEGATFVRDGRYYLVFKGFDLPAAPGVATFFGLRCRILDADEVFMASPADLANWAQVRAPEIDVFTDLRAPRVYRGPVAGYINAASPGFAWKEHCIRARLKAEVEAYFESPLTMHYRRVLIVNVASRGFGETGDAQGLAIRPDIAAAFIADAFREAFNARRVPVIDRVRKRWENDPNATVAYIYGQPMGAEAFADYAQEALEGERTIDPDALSALEIQYGAQRGSGFGFDLDELVRECIACAQGQGTILVSPGELATIPPPDFFAVSQIGTTNDPWLLLIKRAREREGFKRDALGREYVTSEEIETILSDGGGILGHVDDRDRDAYAKRVAQVMALLGATKKNAQNEDRSRFKAFVWPKEIAS